LISFGCDFIGAVRFFSISWSFASLCGVNTYISKVLCKEFGFFLSLLAQGPAVGVVARIGGEATLGFLLFLIGFYIE
jgi:hypothetical protein